MNITGLMKERMVLSFELYPPKTEAGMENLIGREGVLSRLYTLEPEYISCTYGAGGTNIGRNMALLSSIKNSGKTLPLGHFTCVGSSREAVREQIQQYIDNGIDNILALRGDLPMGWTGTGGDFAYASQLVKFIRTEFGNKVTIAVAGSPEGHIDGRSYEADISFLKQKQDEGADFIMTQLCWDTDQFSRWMDDIRRAGVTLPVDAGIMPVVDAAVTIKISLSMNGCCIPRELSKLISHNWIFPNPFAPDEPLESIAAKKASFREAGIEYTLRLIDKYRVSGVAGIHIYTLNKFEDIARLAWDSGLRVQ